MKGKHETSINCVDMIREEETERKRDRGKGQIFRNRGLSPVGFYHANNFLPYTF